MEQKRVSLRRCCAIVSAVLAIGIAIELFESFDVIRKIPKWFENNIQAETYGPNEIVYRYPVLSILSTLVDLAATIAQRVLLGAVVLRIARTGVPFSAENRKNLRWYGILAASNALLFVIENMSLLSVLSCLASFAVVIIWLCWPDELTENGRTPIKVSREKLAGYCYWVFIGLQIYIFAAAIWNALDYLKLSHDIVFGIVVGAVSIVFSLLSVLLYNRIGMVFRVVGRGGSQFDIISEKYIKTSAVARIAIIGVSFLSGVVANIQSAQYGFAESLPAQIKNLFMLLPGPLGLLCLTFAYLYGAQLRRETGQPQPETAEAR